MAREELAKANRRLSGSEALLRATDERLERIRAEQRSTSGEASSVRADELRTRQALAEHVESQRSDRASEVARNEAAVANRSDDLGRAAREHQTLERLKERQRAEHGREQVRHEVLVLDDIAIGRFRRSVA